MRPEKKELQLRGFEYRGGKHMESFGKGIGSLEFLCGVLMSAQLKLGH